MNYFGSFLTHSRALRVIVIILSSIIFVHSMPAQTGATEHKNHYEWAVVGAGPAGILAIDLLRENGIPGSSIAWIDPTFDVGALKQYQQVPANLSTKQWISILENCNHLKKCPSNPLEYLKKHDLNNFYPLSLIVHPLQEVTQWLLTDVHGFKQKVMDMQLNQNSWHILLQNNQLSAHKVILATGSHPRSLQYPVTREISLADALNKTILAQHVNSEDTVAVIGSAHSAVSVLMFLTQLPVKKIINFYTHPFQYTQQTPQGVINAETGLKGPAAQFARDYLETNVFSNVQRVYNDQESRNQWLPQCTKIIYAAGFEQNSLPWTNGNPLQYNDTTGIIGPNLFGFGIAFPEKRLDAQGKIEHRVGMPHFLDYGKRVIPNWIAMQSHKSYL